MFLLKKNFAQKLKKTSLKERSHISPITIRALAKKLAGLLQCNVFPKLVYLFFAAQQLLLAHINICIFEKNWIWWLLKFKPNSSSFLMTPSPNQIK